MNNMLKLFQPGLRAKLTNTFIQLKFQIRVLKILKLYNGEFTNVLKVSLSFHSTAFLSNYFRKGDKPWEIDDFSVEDFLGKGKFGLVYRAIHKASQCEVAIKILSKEAIKTHNMVKQLRREIEIHSRLK